MKTKVHTVSISALESLIDKKDLTDTNNGFRDFSVVDRFDLGIPQVMLYGMMSKDGHITIFQNNVISTLIFEKSNQPDHLTAGEKLRRSRKIGLSTVEICILQSQDICDINKFKSITKTL